MESDEGYDCLDFFNLIQVAGKVAERQSTHSPVAELHGEGASSLGG
jgi:hypothetical protein